jgi:MFS family permease
MIIGETQPQERGIANAVYNILNNVGSAVSVALTGAVVASAALPADGYRWAYMVFAGVSVLALVLSFGVRRKTA